MDKFKQLRKEMVELQLIKRGITDKGVIDAFREIPREMFVAEDLKNSAYMDSPLPIREGQTISQPYIVALMTESLSLSKEDIILEVGTGSGYQAAILSKIVKKVYTVERNPSLAEASKKALKELGIKNVSIKTGDGTIGWPEHAPFDGILVTAAAPYIPEHLKSQLKEGRNMVLPIGGKSFQDLVVVTKINGELEEETLCGCMFVPLIGEQGWESE